MLSWPDGGEPNLAAWKAGQKQIEEFFSDPAVTDYQVRVLSKPAARILFTSPQVPGLGYRVLWIRPRLEEEKNLCGYAVPSLKH